MSDVVKNTRLNIFIGEEEHLAKVERLETAYNGLNQKLKTLTEGTKEYNATVKKMDEVGASLGKARSEYDNQTISIKKAESATTKLREEIKNFTGSSDKLAEMTGKYQLMNGELSVMKQEAGLVGKSLEGAATQSTGAFTKMYGYLRTAANIIPGMGISGIILAVGTALAYAAKEMGLFTEKMDAAIERNEALKEAEKEYTKIYVSIHEMKNAINDAKEGLIEKNSVLKKYNETLGETMGTAKSFNEVEAKLSDKKTTEAYLNMMLLRAAANIELEKASKDAVAAEEAKMKKLNKFGSVTDLFGSLAGYGSRSGEVDEERVAQHKQRVLEAEKKRQADEIKLNEESAKKKLEISNKFMQDAEKIAKSNPEFKLYGDLIKSNSNDGEKLKHDFETFLSELEKIKGDANADEIAKIVVHYQKLMDEAKKFAKAKMLTEAGLKNDLIIIQQQMNDEIAALQQKQFKQRSSDEYKKALQDSQDYYNQEREQANQSYLNNEISYDQLQQRLKSIDLAATNAKLVIAKDYEKNEEQAAKDTTQFKSEQLQKEITDKKQTEDNKAKATKEAYKNELQASDEKYSLLKMQLDKDYSDGLISRKEYNQEDLKLTNDANQDKLAILKKWLLAVPEAQDEINKLLKKLYAEDAKNKETSDKSKFAKWYSENKEMIQIAEQGAAEVGKIWNGLVTIANNRDQADFNSFKTYQDYKLKVLEQNHKAGKISDKQYEAEKQKIQDETDKKQRRMEHDKAIRQRDYAIFEAAIQSAEAIIKALATGGPILGPILAGIIAAATAVQITAISSTPIPAYAQGTEYVDGPGTSTSDSIMTRLSRGERVINAADNAKLGAMSNSEVVSRISAPRVNVSNTAAAVKQSFGNASIIGADTFFSNMSSTMYKQSNDSAAVMNSILEELRKPKPAVMSIEQFHEINTQYQKLLKRAGA